jgi:hypothetical protein
VSIQLAPKAKEQEGVTMSYGLKRNPKIEDLDQREVEELTPDQSEQAQGGSFIIAGSPAAIESATGGAGAGKIKIN